MNREYVEDVISKLNCEDRSEELINKLLTVGFLTGSRAYGTAARNSDWDIVYSVRDTQTVKTILDEFKCAEPTPSNYFSGSFVYEGDEKINLIPVHPDEVLSWKLATAAMTATLEKSMITDKQKKVAVFSGFRALFKAVGCIGER